MSDIFDRLDKNSFVRTTDFTDIAVKRIRSTVESRDFDNMDAEMIKQYILHQSGFSNFKDLMKRYIYRRSGETRPFASIPDDFYIRIIQAAFTENMAPFSFKAGTRPNKKALARSLVENDVVKRDTVFLAGFGLNMSESDVSGFLTNGIHEQDFDFSDPRECIFYYCFRNHLPYSEALKFMEYYKNLPDEKRADAEASFLPPSDEASLLSRLRGIKASDIHERHQESAFSAFSRLAAHAKDIIARIYQEDNGEPCNPEDVPDSALEEFLFSGVPRKGVNLAPIKESSFSGYFKNHRLSRQRVDLLLRRVQAVDRFDLITLLFFIYSQEMLDEHPDERCRKFLDGINAMLAECAMGKYYLPNPYEAFILMCLLSDTPLATYTEIWEMSYEKA